MTKTSGLKQVIIKEIAIKVIQRFDKLDPEVNVNNEPACTYCRELCHAVDDLWEAVCPEYPRRDEFGKLRDPAKRFRS